MIKPDGVQRGLVDEIIRRIQGAGLRIVSRRRLMLDRPTAERFYEVHRAKEFFERAVSHALSGEVVVMLVEGERAISRMRELVGATDPAEAKKGTIRGDFGGGLPNNIIHAADSPESAKREIRMFF
jgi:nucleoside-diphosphate kinase